MTAPNPWILPGLVGAAVIGAAAFLLRAPADPPATVTKTRAKVETPTPSTPYAAAKTQAAGPARPKPRKTFPQFEAMVRALQEEKDARTRAHAATYLGNHAKHCDLDELQMLQTSLADDAAPEVRAAAAGALARFGERALPARAALRKAAQRDREPSVRQAAQAALVAIERSRAPGG